MKTFWLSVSLVLVWALASLVVLLPLLGMAWLLTRVVGLTIAEALLIVAIHTAALIYLLQNYTAETGISALFLSLWLAILSLAIAVLEGLLLRWLLGLTMFHAILTTSVAQLLTAYLFMFALTGNVPAFLRGAFLESFDEGHGEESPPPRRFRRRI
ncbi:MAG: hypothetical protein N2508_06090 [Anaerolineae bacterium]|nr:hypothetical protein [Anaerolineae bacterium]